jgi:hypothetical protein
MFINVSCPLQDVIHNYRMTEDKIRQFNAHCTQIKSYYLSCAMLCEWCYGALVNHNPKWQQHRKQLNVLCRCQGQNQWLRVQRNYSMYSAFKMNTQGVDDIVSCDKQLLQQKGARLPSGSEDPGLNIMPWKQLQQYHALKATTTMQFYICI